MKAAIIGCGRIAGGFETLLSLEVSRPCTHVGTYKEIGIDVVAACDINKELLSSFVKEWDIPYQYSSYEKLIAEHSGIDILSICTDSKSHLDIIRCLFNKADEQNYKLSKIVWIEKPLAYTVNEGKEILELCKLMNVQLVVNNRRRWDLSYDNLSKFLEEDSLGKIKTAEIIAPSGLINTGCHVYDLIEQVFKSDIKSVVGMLIQDESEDPDVVGVAELSNGINVKVECTWKEKFLFTLYVAGEKGSIFLVEEPAGVEKIKFCDENGFPQNLPFKLDDYYGSSLMLRAGENMKEAIETNDYSKLKCIGKDGLKPLQVASAFYWSNKFVNARVNVEELMNWNDKPLPCRFTSFTRDGKKV